MRKWTGAIHWWCSGPARQLDIRGSSCRWWFGRARRGLGRRLRAGCRRRRRPSRPRRRRAGRRLGRRLRTASRRLGRTRRRRFRGGGGTCVGGRRRKAGFRPRLGRRRRWLRRRRLRRRSRSTCPRGTCSCRGATCRRRLRCVLPLKAGSQSRQVDVRVRRPDVDVGRRPAMTHAWATQFGDLERRLHVQQLVETAWPQRVVTQDDVVRRYPQHPLVVCNNTHTPAAHDFHNRCSDYRVYINQSINQSVNLFRQTQTQYTVISKYCTVGPGLLFVWVLRSINRKFCTTFIHPPAVVERSIVNSAGVYILMGQGGHVPQYLWRGASMVMSPPIFGGLFF